MTKMRDWETAESPGSIFRNQSNIVKNILQPVTKRCVHIYIYMIAKIQKNAVSRRLSFSEYPVSYMPPFLDVLFCKSAVE